MKPKEIKEIIENEIYTNYPDATIFGIDEAATKIRRKMLEEDK